MCAKPTTPPNIYIPVFLALSREFETRVRRRELDVDVKYYADGENGIRMEQDLVALQKELSIKPSLEDNAAAEKVEESKKSKKGKK